MSAPETPGALPTVLVVDDEPTIRMLASEILGRMGYAVLVAEDAASGLALLRSPQRIDLLVTDIGLPGGMTGRQMAEAALLERPALVVLFITGYGDVEVTAPDGTGPAMHLLKKPFTIRTLARRVGELLEAARGLGAPAPR